MARGQVGINDTRPRRSCFGIQTVCVAEPVRKSGGCGKKMLRACYKIVKVMSCKRAKSHTMHSKRKKVGLGNDVEMAQVMFDGLKANVKELKAQVNESEKVWIKRTEKSVLLCRVIC